LFALWRDRPWGVDCPLKHGSDLLGLAVVGEEVEEVVEIADRHFEPFFGGGEGGGVEAIAFRLVGGGEVVEGEVEGG
jgi:hypothetical protein